MSNWVNKVTDNVSMGKNVNRSEYKMYIFVSKETGKIVDKVKITRTYKSKWKEYKGRVYKYEDEERKTCYTIPSKLRKMKEVSKNKVASLSYDTILYSSKYWRQTSIKRNLTNWYKVIRKTIEVKVISMLRIVSKKVIREIKYTKEETGNNKYKRAMKKVELSRKETEEKYSVKKTECWE